jgi:hypothetical protein
MMMISTWADIHRITVLVCVALRIRLFDLPSISGVYFYQLKAGEFGKRKR